MGPSNLRLILILTCTLIPRASCDPEEEPHPEEHPPGHGHWSYKNVLEWDKDFPDCGGKDQSPIDVITQEVTYDPTLKPIGLSGYNLSSRDPLKLENNGHTVSLKLPESLEIVEGLGLTYRASQLHFHWGSHGHPGSEHAVNGQKFPGEIHVVHYSSLYQSIDEAQEHPGGLAVLAAFIQEGEEENHNYQHLLDHLQSVKEAGQSVEIPGFDIEGLLPPQRGRYFRYNGSLTTPPCLQTVNWTIFNQTVLLSSNQLSILEDTLHHDHDHVLQMNFREPQSLWGRAVLSSFRAPVGGRRAGAEAPAPTLLPPASADDSASSNGAGRGAQGADDPALGTGDMLAIIFAVLFLVTAVAFFIYVRRNRNPRSSDKSNVIYKATNAEDNMA